MSNDPIPANGELAADPFAATPLPPAVPQHSRLGTVGIVTAFVLGAIMLLAGLVLPQLPISDGYSLSDVHSLCTGPVGQFAAGLSDEARTSCTKIGWLYKAGWISAAGGLCFLFAGVMAVRRRRAMRR